MQQISTVRLLALCLRFQPQDHVPRVNKSELNGENTFHGDLFETEDNY